MPMSFGEQRLSRCCLICAIGRLFPSPIVKTLEKRLVHPDVKL
jgi:hypothetical protein